MRRRLAGCLFLMLTGASGARADDVIDVSKQWKEHASSAPVIAPNTSTTTASAASLLESTATIPDECGCESMSVPEKLLQATYAFTGVVEELTPPQKGRQKIVLDVDEIFKGSPRQDMEIVTDIAGNSCDLTFKEGDKYLIYAQWQWGSNVTSLCMGTKRIETARSDANALGPSESMKEKLYIHLRNACMGRIDTPCCLSSLKAMRVGYSVPEPEEGCPAGSKPDRLLCGGSYTWCIPILEKDHRPSSP